MSWFLGLDIGQTNDPTALAAVEQSHPEEDAEIRRGRVITDTGPAHYALRHVARFELGTPYPEIAEEVATLMRRSRLEKGTLVVDATGVGRPIVEMLEEEGLSPMSIWITGGDSISKDGREYRVPKRELASTVQALLQSGRLKFAEGLPLRDTFVDELQTFRAKIDVSTGEASFEHWRESDTDDLVLALCCALWYADRAPGRSGGGARVPL
jgi:hypothetical protein